MKTGNLNWSRAFVYHGKLTASTMSFSNFRLFSDFISLVGAIR